MKLITFIENYYDGEGTLWTIPKKIINIEHMISFDYEIAYKDKEVVLSLIFNMINGKNVKLPICFSYNYYKDAEHEVEGTGAYKACISEIEKIIEAINSEETQKNYHYCD